MKKIFVICCLTIMCALLCCGCNESINYFDVVVNTYGSIYGTVSGGGNYAENTEITIKASPKVNAKLEENKFVGWIYKNQLVSKDLEYKFVVSKNTYGKYIALFELPEEQFLTLNSITYSPSISSNTDDSTKTTLAKLTIGFGETLLTIYDYLTVKGEALSELIANSFTEFQIPLAVNKYHSSINSITGIEEKKNNNMYVKITEVYISEAEEDIIITSLKSLNEFEITDKTFEPSEDIPNAPLLNFYQNLDWENATFSTYLNSTNEGSTSENSSKLTINFTNLSNIIHQEEVDDQTIND